MKLRVALEYLTRVEDWGAVPKTIFKLSTDNEEHIKLKIPQYCDSDDEIYLRTINQFTGMVKDYDLHANENGGTRGVYRKFRRCLDGDALETFDEISRDDLDNPNNNLDEDDFNLHLLTLSEAILGEHAFENEVEYLRNTKKPKGMPSYKWIRRIKNINANLERMSGNATKMTENELVKYVISPNIPVVWKSKWTMAGGARQDLAEATKTLSNIEQALDAEDLNEKLIKKEEKVIMLKNTFMRVCLFL